MQTWVDFQMFLALFVNKNFFTKLLVFVLRSSKACGSHTMMLSCDSVCNCQESFFLCRYFCNNCQTKAAFSFWWQFVVAVTQRVPLNCYPLKQISETVGKSEFWIYRFRSYYFDLPNYYSPLFAFSGGSSWISSQTISSGLRSGTPTARCRNKARNHQNVRHSVSHFLLHSSFYFRPFKQFCLYLQGIKPIVSMLAAIIKPVYRT